MTQTKWTIGDVYYQAEATLGGRPWDIGELGEECETLGI